MPKKVESELHKRVHKHTSKCLFDWADNGHGCQSDKALNSASRLIDFIEGLISKKTSDGIQAGVNAAVEMISRSQEVR